MTSKTGERPTGSWIVLAGVALYLIAGFLPYFHFADSTGTTTTLALGAPGRAGSILLFNFFQWLWPIALVAAVAYRAVAGSPVSRDAVLGAGLICGAELVAAWLLLGSHAQTGVGQFEIGFWLTVAALVLMLGGVLMTRAEVRQVASGAESTDALEM